jgi:hypothetical protein
VLVEEYVPVVTASSDLGLAYLAFLFQMWEVHRLNLGPVAVAGGGGEFRDTGFGR